MCSKKNNCDSNRDISIIRNIGIIAHIDAGKTTFTERTLYYTNNIKKAGDVHDGNTTTDYLQQERDRGITIVSAAVTIYWQHTFNESNKCHINIIDTPGHVDFAIEVERSVSILDGCIVIIDGSAGVETQTESVWHITNRYKVSRIIFANKMDKIGASYDVVMSSLLSKFGQSCIPVQYPIYNNDVFIGQIDILSRSKIIWEDEGHKYKTIDYSNCSEDEKGIINHHYDKLIQKICEFGYDDIYEEYISNGFVDIAKIKHSIRSLVIKGNIYPIFFGTAFKHKGIHQVLDAIIDYFPSPCDLSLTAKDKSNNDVIVAHNSTDNVGFIFKLCQDTYAGEILYTRIYSGCLKEGDKMKNSRTGRVIRLQKIVRFYADKRINIKDAYAGDIVGIIADGCITGDTISDINKYYLIEKIKLPKSIFDVVVTPKTKDDQDKFAKYIKNYLKEDPTIKIRQDTETNTTVISGVGKLQIDILIDRLRTERKVNLCVEEPKIPYRETITKSVHKEYLHKKQSGGAGQYAGISFELTPMPRDSKEDFKFINDVTHGAIPMSYIPVIEEAFREYAKSGIINGSPVIYIQIRLYDGKHHKVDSKPNAYKLACMYALKEALKEACAVLLEPYFSIKIYTPTEYMNSVISDLCSCNGTIVSMEDIKGIEGRKKIVAEVAFSSIKLFSYVDRLRGLTKGQGSFESSFIEYREASSSESK